MVKPVGHLILKPINFYNTEKHIKCTLILKVNYTCCVHITDFGLIVYQRILTLFIHETKAYKITFLLIHKGLLYKELTPYEAMNLTSSDYPI